MIDYLLYPSIRPEDGLGHIMRMVRLHKQLANSGIYVPQQLYATLLSRMPAIASYHIVHDLRFSRLVILDMPWIDDSVLSDLQFCPNLVAIDLGGNGRHKLPFLIDILPYPGYAAHYRHFRKHFLQAQRALPQPVWDSANIFEPAFLSLPQKPYPQKPEPQKPPSSRRMNRVLVTFGGSDSGGLSSRFVSFLQHSAWLQSLSGKIILAANVWPLSRPTPPSTSGPVPLPNQWEYLQPQASLAGLFAEADLCICSYGLSAWEAQYAGVKTIVINTSSYHKRLARLSGFLSLPLGQIERLQHDALCDRLVTQVERVQGIKPVSLANYLAKLAPAGLACCPGCGNKKDHWVLSRSASRSYFRCADCGLIYLQSFSTLDTIYDRTYFFEQYKQQYGKTYLEDFPHIQSLGTQRMFRIKKTLNKRRGRLRLLDIGCAYGPFMVAVAQAGYLPEGIDICEDAVTHVQKELHFSAWAGDISDATFRQGFTANSYDVITLWYVIEHFPNLSEILPWINHLLKPRGVFAFSTPNSRGVSGRKNLSAFLQQGPADHYSIWDPRQTSRLIGRYGFRLRRWKSTGHHGDRFPGILGSSLLRGFSQLLSRVFSLGDGFEAYCIKVKEVKAIMEETEGQHV